MCHIHAVANDKQVFDHEAGHVGADIHGAFTGLFQKATCEHTTGAARGQKIPRVGKGSPGFKNVVHQNDIATLHVALNVPDNRHLTGRHRRLAIA